MGLFRLSYVKDDECHNDYCLEACSLCQKSLGPNSDIFMYRGNTPFCSQECRQEQIDFDDAKEKRRKRSSANPKKALRQTSNDSTNKEPTPDKAVRRGTVAVA